MKQALGFHLQDHCWIAPGKAESISKLVTSAFITGIPSAPRNEAGWLFHLSPQHVSMSDRAPGAPHMHCQALVPQFIPVPVLQGMWRM